MATGKPLGPPIPGVDGGRTFVRWAPGNRVAAGFGDGSVQVFDMDPAAWVRRACEVAGRQLTADEWRDALPDRPYQTTCPER